MHLHCIGPLSDAQMMAFAPGGDGFIPGGDHANPGLARLRLAGQSMSGRYFGLWEISYRLF